MLLPENLFYNTTAPGIILLLNRAKPADRRGQMILINASLHFVKRKPKNVPTDEGIGAVVDTYRAWETRPKLSRVVTLDEIRAADFNLSPSQHVEVNERIAHRPLPTILADLAATRAERERADRPRCRCWPTSDYLKLLPLRKCRGTACSVLLPKDVSQESAS